MIILLTLFVLLGKSVPSPIFCTGMVCDTVLIITYFVFKHMGLI